MWFSTSMYKTSIHRCTLQRRSTEQNFRANWTMVMYMYNVHCTYERDKMKNINWDAKPYRFSKNIPVEWYVKTSKVN